MTATVQVTVTVAVDILKPYRLKAAAAVTKGAAG